MIGGGATTEPRSKAKTPEKPDARDGGDVSQDIRIEGRFTSGEPRINENGLWDSMIELRFLLRACIVCLLLRASAVVPTIPNCENPLQDEHFYVFVAHPVVKVEFHVKDNDVFGAELMEVVEIPVAKIMPGNMIND
ncbi:hypothetical protein NL676_039566 [Syzygium grande]|nr:hypothetical protein NL676_039566 [Syzygium grande]